MPSTYWLVIFLFFFFLRWFTAAAAAECTFGEERQEPITGDNLLPFQRSPFEGLGNWFRAARSRLLWRFDVIALSAKMTARHSDHGKKRRKTKAFLNRRNLQSHGVNGSKPQCGRPVFCQRRQKGGDVGDNEKAPSGKLRNGIVQAMFFFFFSNSDARRPETEPQQRCALSAFASSPVFFSRNFGALLNPRRHVMTTRDQRR